MEYDQAQQQQPLDPWFSMWTKPRATIQQIIDTNPTHMVLVLAAVAGFSQSLDRIASRGGGDVFSLPTIFLIAAVAGPVGGILGLYLGGFLIRWTGEWIGGQASSQNVRAAIAWSNVPIVWTLPVWIPQLALFGKELFTTEMPRIEGSLGLTILLLVFGLFWLVVGIWQIVLLLKSLGQVQGFSAWKALGNVMLPVAIIAVPIILLLVIAGVFG